MEAAEDVAECGDGGGDEFGTGAVTAGAGAVIKIGRIGVRAGAGVRVSVRAGGGAHDGALVWSGERGSMMV